MIQKNINEYAHYESGRVIFAYLHGYTCKDIKILPGKQRRIEADINFKEDQFLVDIVSNIKKRFEDYNNLAQEVKGLAVKVITNVRDISLGPGAAHYHYSYSQGGKIPIGISMLEPDKERLASLELMVSQLLKRPQPEFVKGRGQELLNVVFIPEVWNPIEKLAKTLLKKPSALVRQPEIEEILKECDLEKIAAQLNEEND